MSGRPNDWLLTHRRNRTSQFGEDGILDQVFNLVGERSKWCVEFGAYDGRLWSNTYSLLAERNFNGVLIEANPARFRRLQETYADNPRAHLLESMVALSGPESLDELLAGTPIPPEFDLLSIDVDGND